MNASTKRLVTDKRNLLALLCATPLLTACYVVPVHPDGRVYPPPGTNIGQPAAPAVAQAPVTIAAAPGPVTFTARLYPSNEVAARTGVIAGTVISPQDGKGVFTIPYNGDTLSGKATRTSVGTLHTGVANAAGPRGTFVRCNYRMNTQTQGIGECLFSDGARFQMHVGG